MSTRPAEERAPRKPMSKLSLSIQIGGVLLIAATIGSFAAEDEPSQSISIDQNLDQATLRRYHHTHQGTVIPPAAWLAAIENADDDGKYMANENLQQLGFIVDN